MTRISIYDDMMMPTLQALQNLDGSGVAEEIYGQAAALLNLANEFFDTRHKDISQSEVEYRLTWSQPYLKKRGLIDNTGSAGAGYPFALQMPDRLLMGLMYLRLYRNQSLLSYLFAFDESSISRELIDKSLKHSTNAA